MIEEKVGAEEEVLQPVRRRRGKSSRSLPPLPFDKLKSQNQKLFFVLPLLCILRTIFYLHRASLGKVLLACADDDKIGGYLYYLVQLCLQLPEFDEGDTLLALSIHFDSMVSSIPQARCVFLISSIT